MKLNKEESTLILQSLRNMLWEAESRLSILQDRREIEVLKLLIARLEQGEQR